MSGSKWHHHYLSTPRLYFRRADNRVLRIIAAFDNDVGSEVLDEIEGRVLREDHHEIDAFERCQHVGALGVAPNRARRTFDAPY